MTPLRAGIGAPSRLAFRLQLWVLFAVLPSVVVGGWLFTAVYRDLTQTRQQAAQTVARQTLDTLERLVFERRGDAQVFSGLPAVRALDRERLVAVADHLVTTYAPYYCLVLVADRHGSVLAVNHVDGFGNPIPSARLLGQSVAGEPWFQQTVAGTRKVLIEDFHQDPLVDEVHHDRRPVLSFSAPIVNEEGAVVGVWSTRMNMAPIEDLLSTLVNPATLESRRLSYPLILRSSKGEVILSTEPPSLPSPSARGRVGEGAPLLAVAASTGFSGVPGLGWHVEVYQPAGAVDDRMVLAALAGWLGLVVTGGVIGLGWAIHHRVIRPVLALAEYARSQAHRARLMTVGLAVESQEVTDDLATRSDELGELAQAVGTMLQEVGRQVNRLAVMNELARGFQREALSPSSLLTGVLSAAQELTGAKYAALGVFDEAGERLVQFQTVGLDEEAKAAIGALPTGRGLLGHLAKETGVLRLKDLRAHQASVGFPAHHPPMTSFMGVSLRAHGKLFGRLYLTDKVGPGGVVAEFTELDEQTITALAYQASSAIETAHLFEQVRQSESRLRAILDSVQEGIYGVDRQGHCLFMNKAGAALLGYGADELVGRSIHRIIHHTRENGDPYPLDECPMYSVLRTSLPARSDNEVLWKRDGTSLAVVYTAQPLCDASGAVIGAVVSFTDISERRRLEEQLRQSQKMEAVGRLAGGIAHDFNNLLTAVLGYSGLLVQSLDPSDARHADARAIQNAGERATALTRQLLAISRKQVLDPKVLDLNVLIGNLDQMLRRLIREDIALLTVLDPALGPIRADQSQIEQVIMNLALNARDAMPEGGRLTIETANVELDEAYCRAHAEVAPGAYVMLAVSDTGCGMDPETLSRCFEPFFTTKPVGKGTGLGLATVYGIVKQSGGSVWVYSEPGHGTTFKVYLPLVAAVESAVETAVRNVPSEHAAVTILLVEDDETVRQFAHRALAAAGHTVLEAADGEEALRVSLRHPGVIHLLITDVVMPGMSGRVLAERLAAERPDLKVLYVSGYAENAIVHNGILDAGTAFLHKPLTADVLLRKVREVLDT